MKRIVLGILVMALVFSLPIVISATPFTMNLSQLGSLYETYENPSATGTSLLSVYGNPDGVKYIGNLNQGGAGFSQVQIGANFWGIPYGGSAGDGATNVALGMGSLADYSSYRLRFANMNENPWMYNLYFNVGYTDWGETNYYIQNDWTSINPGSYDVLSLNFNSAHVWGGGYSGELVDLSTLGMDMDHVSNIGFSIAGNVPLSGYDYTFETTVSPVPEPATMFLFGLGLVGGGLLKRKKRK